MRTRAGTLALAGTLGLGGLLGGVVLAPAVAVAATSEQSTTGAVADRIGRISEALQELVDDGTLTEQQRDAVATTLDEALPQRGPGHGHARHAARHLALDVAAETLGVSEGELRAALRDGQSLSDVAQEQEVDVQALVDALVTAAEQRLAEAVERGRLTQEQADARAAELPERITELVEREGRGHPGRGWGPGGRPGG